MGTDAAATMMALMEQAQQEALDQMLEPFEEFLYEIADAISTEPSVRHEFVPELEELEQDGWMIRAPILHIWDGERNADKLTEGLDANSNAVIRRLLTILSEQE